MDMMAKPARAADKVVADFIETGAHVVETPLDAAAATRLLASLRGTRRFDGGLFLSEAEFDADPQYTGVNPRPGRNLLDRFEDQLGFVEQAPQIVEAVSGLLGDDYQILNRKVVAGIPARSIPDWLKARIHGNPVNNLGPYMRPEYRDVTYFYGIDFHQDLIDYKEREADFLTLYIYLHPVTQADAPLYLLEGSHALGGAVFPHDLSRLDAERWRYANGGYGETTVGQRILTGNTGFAAMWHACTLHGTQPDAADHERISLRYLMARGSATRVGMDTVNESLRGPLSLASTRQDLAADGSAQLRANTVLKA